MMEVVVTTGAEDDGGGGDNWSYVINNTKRAGCQGTMSCPERKLK